MCTCFLYLFLPLFQSCSFLYLSPLFSFCPTSFSQSQGGDGLLKLSLHQYALEQFSYQILDHNEVCKNYILAIRGRVACQLFVTLIHKESPTRTFISIIERRKQRWEYYHLLLCWRASEKSDIRTSSNNCKYRSCSSMGNVIWKKRCDEFPQDLAWIIICRIKLIFLYLHK